MNDPDPYLNPALHADLETETPGNLLVIQTNLGEAIRLFEARGELEKAAIGRRQRSEIAIKLQELGLTPR